MTESRPIGIVVRPLASPHLVCRKTTSGRYVCIRPVGLVHRGFVIPVLTSHAQAMLCCTSNRQLWVESLMQLYRLVTHYTEYTTT